MIEERWTKSKISDMAYMNYTPRTLDELLEANPQPMIERIRKDGIPAETDAGENSNGEL